MKNLTILLLLFITIITAFDTYSEDDEDDEDHPLSTEGIVWASIVTAIVGALFLLSILGIIKYLHGMYCNVNREIEII